jgi:multiple sugar transport system substrate-binding protein
MTLTIGNRMKAKTFLATTGLVLASVSLAACGGGGSADSKGTIDYWLWDANQQPAYQKCADEFHKANPDLTVKITQRGWDDYWATLTTGFQSGEAPDVFTDHVSKYPEFAGNGVLLPLDDAVENDNIDLTQYAPGLADLWVAQDGHRYGLPKDWDTVALFYNKDMVKAAGLTDAEMSSLSWNPDDGGTFEDAVAKLSVDKNGTHGDEPGFDPKNVKVYGLGLPGSGGGNGQTEYSWFTGTTGWQYTDKNPWGTHYNYDDPRFQAAITWWAGLVDKGFMPPLETTVGSSMNDNFGAGKSAINANGSWMIGTYAGYTGVNLGIAPTPVGPDGERASMFNGLADSIFAGTDNKEGAIKWVEFLASTDCENIVGEQGVVFPAIQSGIDDATKAFNAEGVDVTPFTTQVDDGTTFLYPITDFAADITAIMQPAMDAVLGGKAPASSLNKANDQVNALFN